MDQNNQELIARSSEKQAPREPNSQEKDVANSDRTYWFAVNIAWVVFFMQMLLYMYLVFGPNFWMEFLK